jgi:hypothetical protein
MAVFVGDGSGPGPAAGRLIATMRTILRTHAGLHRSPGSTLARVAPLFHALSATLRDGARYRLPEQGIADVFPL